MKQETLEEAVLIYCENRYYKNTDAESFRAGAKWQAERIYSEEELHKIIGSYQAHIPLFNHEFTYDVWFEQFKKK